MPTSTICYYATMSVCLKSLSVSATGLTEDGFSSPVCRNVRHVWKKESMRATDGSISTLRTTKKQAVSMKP